MNKSSTSKGAKSLAANIAVVAGPDAEYYATKSKSDNTWRTYGAGAKHFGRFCDALGVSALPADVAVLRRWLVELGEGGYAITTVKCYLAGVVEQHKQHGYLLERWKLSATLEGLEREFGSPRRRADPIRMVELRGIVEGLSREHLADVRDAALLLVGWAAMLRRAELTGLDWDCQGDGDGVLKRDRFGIMILLRRSKWRKAKDVTELAVREEHMPSACAAVDRWARLANLRPGSPVFRGIAADGVLNSTRMQPKAVAEIVKKRRAEYAAATGQPAHRVKEIVDQSRGHSLRSGLITEATLSGKSEIQIMAQSRHNKMDVAAEYVRLAQGEQVLRDLGF